MIYLSKVFLLLFSLLMLVTPIEAATKQELANKIEKYFSNLRTYEADLVQLNPDGSISRGKLYLHRPDKFRVHYTDPKEQVVLSDGKFFIEYNPKENIPNFISLDSTPASLLLKNEIKLSGDITINNIDQQGGLIQATLSRTQEPEVGSMTMVFQQSPMRLVHWVIHDAQDNITEVSLKNIRENKPIEAKLFKFQH